MWRRLLAGAILGPAILAMPVWGAKAEPRNEPVEQGVVLPVSLAEGAMIESVYIHLVNPPAAAEADREAQTEIAQAFGLGAGARFALVLAEQGLQRVRSLPVVARAGACSA